MTEKKSDNIGSWITSLIEDFIERSPENTLRNPAQGKAFDPNIHEALSSEDSREVSPGHVLRVFKKPYKLHDKVIRPGQVVVAKTPAQ